MFGLNWIFYTVAIASIVISDVSSRPAENESPYFNVDTEAFDDDDDDAKEAQYISNYEINQMESEPDETKYILDKIKHVNERLSKPEKMQLNNNHPENLQSSFVLDRETLRKLQQLISHGNLKVSPNKNTQQQLYFSNLGYRDSYSKALMKSAYKEFASTTIAAQQQMPTYAALMNLPVLVVPPSSVGEVFSPYDIQNNEINDVSSSYMAKQRPPQLPFQIQWPFAQYFPILIKDPFIGMLHGGGWNNFIEYGQLADVCSRKQKSDNEKSHNEISNEELEKTLRMYSSRQGKALKKRTVSHDSESQKLAPNTKSSRKIFGTKTKITTKRPLYDEDGDDPIDEVAGDLRLPFNRPYGVFGDKKPLPELPSPGFFINRLKVRKGGVAIAGPGGVATAGRGGTALVGPGGLALTQPGGLAIAGPKAKVFALSEDMDLSSLVNRLHAQADKNNGIVNAHSFGSEGRLVATGPVVYYHELDQS